MTKPTKTKTDLFAVLEDDIKQFRDALFGVLRAVPQQITLAIRRGLREPKTDKRQGRRSPTDREIETKLCRSGVALDFSVRIGVATGTVQRIAQA